MSANFMHVELIGESYDAPCLPNRANTVIKTKNNGFKAVDSSTWDDWKLAIIFPDQEKALYFIENFKIGMMDFREGMIKEDYIFHVIHFIYPRSKKLYADQLSMTKDYKREEF
tara:strand:+ start:11625 stop:11963 length:339 start_codon:yes stop_codon:yes gene_type:complete